MEFAVGAVGAVIGATFEPVLKNLLTISGEGIDLFGDFKKDVEELKSSFLLIKDLLYDAEKQQITQKAVTRWLKDLESVAFKADNVFDELNYHVLRNKNENNMMTKAEALVFRRKMAHKIKKINENLKSINQRARDFGLQEMKHVEVRSDPVASRETDPFTVDPIVLGREDDVSNIVEMLTTSPAEQAFSVLPIVGMGGLGKTTLARQVFNHEKIKAHFEEQVWVYVSRKFDAKILLKNILESLKGKSIQLETKGAILRKLQEKLGAKRYLLVLDDLWNESREEWDDFLNSLSGISSVMGNGMIVTTRGDNIASKVKTLSIHKLKGLSKEECWSVIKAKAFRGGEAPSEFETIGRNIANKCQGLPLAAKVVGGLLCDKSKDVWLDIEKTWLSKFGEDENAISKVLKFSFDHLSSPSLKKCFSYCSIFPKGSYIEKENLIELWMAEGFLAADGNYDMETMGVKFFNNLVQNSLLQETTRDEFGKIKVSNMHDLVHDLAIQVLGSKSNCGNDPNLNDIYPVRYIGLESIRDDLLKMPKQQTRCVRTLIFNGEVSDNMFSHFKSLHALVLKSRDVKEFPSSITELIHLRLLDISLTQIKYLPDSIDKLCHLQTLRIGNSTKRLPNTLKNLTCLRHLHVYGIELPPGIRRLTSLQTLPDFPVGHEKGCRIGELGSLKNLKGRLQICNLERVHDKEEAKSAYLIRKANIDKLMFKWGESRDGETNDENVLDGLQPHPNIKSLTIYHFEGKCFPSWALKMEVRDDLEGRSIGLNNLMEIRLEHCKKCEEIPMLGHLPHLKSLYLDDLTNVSSIGPLFYGTSSSSGVGKIVIFPALEMLKLSNMPNLIEWVEPEFPSAGGTRQREIVVFPLLEYLQIVRCAKLMSAPSHFRSLKELRIRDSASALENICRNKLFSLRKMEIGRAVGLVCLPHALFCNSENLSELLIRGCHNLTQIIPSLQGRGASLRVLEIWECPNLRELPDDLHSLHLLEKLWIFDCPNLKSIPYPSSGQSHQGFTSLRSLKIDKCYGLTHLPSELIESCAPSLETLYLRRLSSLTNLPMVIRCLKNMPRFTKLKIIDVPILTDFSVEIGPLDSLRSLTILPSSSHALDYTLFQEFLGNIFNQWQSLRCLCLGGMEDWDSLPNQLQYLTALHDLTLYHFGIEALPEWLGNMLSLQLIALFHCQNLRHRPSKVGQCHIKYVQC